MKRTLRSVHQRPGVEHLSGVDTSNDRSCGDSKADEMNGDDSPSSDFEDRVDIGCSPGRLCWISDESQTMPEHDGVKSHSEV